MSDLLSENRRSSRLPAELLIRVVGVDAEAKRRQCDISLTGIFFKSNVVVGGPATMQTLEIQNSDDEEPVVILARVVRAFSSADMRSMQTTYSTALEFLPQDASASRGVEALLHALIATRPLGQGETLTDYLARPTAKFMFESPMRVRECDSQRMLIDTSWRAEVGESFRCELHAPAAGKLLHLHGVASSVEQLPEKDASGQPWYRVQVTVESKLPSPVQEATAMHLPSDSLGGAVEALLGDLMLPSSAPIEVDDKLADPIQGQIGRVWLPHLLRFIANTGHDGVLTLKQERDEVAFAFRAGKVVGIRGTLVGYDAEGLAGVALSWNHGHFYFDPQGLVFQDDINVGVETLMTFADSDAG